MTRPTEPESLLDIIPAPTMRERHATARTKFLTSLWLKHRQPEARERAQVAEKFRREAQKADAVQQTALTMNHTLASLKFPFSILTFGLLLQTIIHTLWKFLATNYFPSPTKNHIEVNIGHYTADAALSFALMTSYAIIGLGVLLMHTALIHRAAAR